MLRGVERALGVLAGVVGLAGWAYAVFGPIYVSSTGARASVAQMSLNPVSVAFLVVMLASVGAVTVGANEHGRVRSRRGLLALCLGAIVLLAGTIISGFSIGLLLAPGALLALAAALVGSLAELTGPARAEADG